MTLVRESRLYRKDQMLEGCWRNAKENIIFKFKECGGKKKKIKRIKYV